MLKPHPLAETLPLLSGAKLAELEKDIKENGQREPITLYEGMILDGRNRYKACQNLGIEPLTAHYDEKNPAGYVVSMNITRRHLTPSQKAAAAQALLPQLEAEAKKRQRKGGDDGRITQQKKGEKGLVVRIPQAESAPEKPAPEPKRKPNASEEAAEIVGVSPSYIRGAKRIGKEAPELLDRVQSGELTIPEATRRLPPKPAKPAKPGKPAKRPRETVAKKRAQTNKVIDGLKKLAACLETGEIVWRDATPDQRTAIAENIRHATNLVNQLTTEVSNNG